MEPCQCQTQNLRFVRGDTETLSCTYQSSNGAWPPVFTPINIAGAAIQMICKRYANDADAAALFALIVGSGVTITSAANGQFSCVVPKAATAGLPVGVPFSYNVIVELGAQRQTVMTGTLTLRENVGDAKNATCDDY